MVVRTTPQDYFKGELRDSARVVGVVPTAAAIVPSTVKEYIPVYVNSNTGAGIDDVAFKYIVIIGLTIVSLAAIKYLLEK